jgi:hypothetical protein
LDLFPVVVLGVAGMLAQAILSATSRTIPFPEILRPATQNELEGVVFFLDIDYDDATW